MRTAGCKKTGCCRQRRSETGDRCHRDGPVASHRDRISRVAVVRCGVGDPPARGRHRSRQGGPWHWTNRPRRSCRHRRPRRCARSVPVPGAPVSAAAGCHNGRVDRGIWPECQPAGCRRIRSVPSRPRSLCCAGSPRNSPRPRRPAGHPASARRLRPGHQDAAVPIERWFGAGERASERPGSWFPVPRGRAAVG